MPGLHIAVCSGSKYIGGSLALASGHMIVPVEITDYFTLKKVLNHLFFKLSSL